MNLFGYLDNEFCYAKDKNEAKQIFEEKGVLIEEESYIDKLDDDYVLCSYELFGLGGYESIEAQYFIRKNKGSHYIGNEKSISDGNYG